MLWYGNRLRGYRLHAADGDIGEVADMLFDDHAWTVRYLVADTGGWLFGRRVLIAPQSVGEPDQAARRVPVALTREQVRNSPDIATDQPVSRQHEVTLHGYYGWWPYWSASGAAVPSPQSIDPVREGLLRDRMGQGDPHLRSAGEVGGYQIEASDGALGSVSDILAETPGWALRWLVVDTGRWLPGRRVLLAPDWVEDIDWSRRAARVALSRDEIRASPPLESERDLGRAYEARLFDHYQRRHYWAEEGLRS